MGKSTGRYTLTFEEPKDYKKAWQHVCQELHKEVAKNKELWVLIDRMEEKLRKLERK